MVHLQKGRYTARLAEGPADVKAAQRLRAFCFGLKVSLDIDSYDSTCTHVLIEDTATGTLVCCYRLLTLCGADLPRCYAAQFYELSALETYEGLMMELGRFCIHPDWRDPDIQRIAWAAMTDLVDAQNVQLLFGCSSFAGTETAAYLDAFAMLRARHLAPPRWLPRVKAPDVFRFAARLRRKPDLKKAMRRMPPLLRTYLMMGAGSATMRWWTGR